jgi:hypothetical protein
MSAAVRDFEETVDPNADTNDMLVYVKGVIVAWYALAIFFGLLMVAIAYGGDQLQGKSGRDLGLSIGLGLSFFCATGGLDATWRSFFAYAARRRLQRNGSTDERYQRAMQRARPRNGSLVLQALVGIVTGLIVIGRL